VVVARWWLRGWRGFLVWSWGVGWWCVSASLWRWRCARVSDCVLRSVWDVEAGLLWVVAIYVGGWKKWIGGVGRKREGEIGNKWEV
jgi:hypothetical protein